VKPEDSAHAGPQLGRRGQSESHRSAVTAGSILINRTHETVLRFLPPFIIEKKHWISYPRARCRPGCNRIRSRRFKFKDRTKSFHTIHVKEIEESKVNTQLISHPQAYPPGAQVCAQDLISTRDLSPQDAEGLLHLAGLMKARPADFCDALSGKQLVMFL